jgi:hypothetical protein
MVRRRGSAGVNFGSLVVLIGGLSRGMVGVLHSGRFEFLPDNGCFMVTHGTLFTSCASLGAMGDTTLRP